MPKKTAAKRKTGAKRSLTRSAAANVPDGAQDVTEDADHVLVDKIKLICDDDTNVHLFRAKGRLYMLVVERGGASGTMPAS